MKLCSDILYRALSQHVVVKCSGKSIDSLTLNAPVFYDGHSPYADDMVYVGRSGELPSPPDDVSCLIICVGGVPTSWSPRECCVFTISSGIDILSVFNILQEVFSQYNVWNDEMWQLLNTTANVEIMINKTAFLLKRWIILTNPNHEHVVSEYPEDFPLSSGTMSLDEIRLIANDHHDNIKHRSPFFFSSERGDAYCINIFVQNEYVGVLMLQADSQMLFIGEKLIFEYFYQFILKAVKRQVEGSPLVNTQTLFLDLLNCYPVSKAKLEMIPAESYWICIAFHPERVMRNISVDYFCRQVEVQLGKGYSVPFPPYAAMLVPVSDGVSYFNYPDIEKGFQELGLYAGISMPFNDILQLRGYFRQAAVALQNSLETKLGSRVTYFRDIVLPYVLKNSIGEFAPEQLLPPELLELRTNPAYGDEYWNTLKVYLDNESNATQASKILYVHRTTLIKRLNRIEELLDLSSPDKRLYIRYCIYLMEQSHQF